jgi:hypothetical protein
MHGASAISSLRSGPVACMSSHTVIVVSLASLIWPEVEIVWLPLGWADLRLPCMMMIGGLAGTRKRSGLQAWQRIGDRNLIAIIRFQYNSITGTHSSYFSMIIFGLVCPTYRPTHHTQMPKLFVCPRPELSPNTPPLKNHSCSAPGSPNHVRTWTGCRSDLKYLRSNLICAFFCQGLVLSAAW